MPFHRHDLLLLIFLMPCVASCGPRREPPRAVKGVMDLSTWDFETQGIVGLDGEWELYWKRLLRPGAGYGDSVKAHPIHVPVPGAWNDYAIHGTRLGREGYGTYRLRVALGTMSGVLAVRVPEVNTAYELWADGVRIAGCGTVGTSRATMSPQQMPRTAFLTPRSDTLELVMQVSNYSYALGGVWRRLSLGTDQQMMTVMGYLNTVYMLLFGVLVVLGAYHLWLFFNEKRDRGYLYFGVVCQGVLLVSVFIGDHFFRRAVASLPWACTIRTFMVSVVLMTPIGALFFKTLCPEEFSRRVLLAIHIICLPFAVAIAVAPMPAVHHVFTAFYVPNIAIIVYGLFVVGLAAIHRREGAVFVLAGYAVHALAIINDQLSYAGVIDTIFLTPLGIACWSLGSSVAINKRFLKSRVQVRAQREQLAQAEKLASIGTLVSGVAHEISNPNNAVLLNTQFHKRAWQGLRPVLDHYAQLQGDFIVGDYDYREFREVLPDSIERTMRNAERIKSTVSDLCIFARKDNADCAELVDCNVVVQSALKVIEHRIAELTSALEVSLAEGAVVVKGNRQRLEQVVMNLVLNACQALADPAKTVQVATAYEARGSQAVITVRDEGTGMDEATLASALNPFFTTKSPTDGTGLGLSISSTIVVNHGGKLEIDSTPGKGTTVRVVLPAATSR
ncbi:MAG: hypothetical protein GF331_07175 [Chitinivibrionales bacterium]|nr:hypothetical protein [Chitinivibrionales bacterium]